MSTYPSYAHTYIGLYRAYARALFILLSAAFIVSIFTYGYFLKSAAFSAAQWEGNQTEIAFLAGEVADLETAYLTRIQSLGMEEAALLGLHEQKTVVFVARGSNTKLTFADADQKTRSR